MIGITRAMEEVSNKCLNSVLRRISRALPFSSYGRLKALIRVSLMSTISGVLIVASNWFKDLIAASLILGLVSTVATVSLGTISGRQLASCLEAQ